MIHKRIAHNQNGFTRIVLNEQGWPCRIVHVECDEDPILALLKLKHDKAFHAPHGCQVEISRADYNAITDYSDNHYLLAKALYPKVVSGQFISHPDAPAHPAIAERMSWLLRMVERRRAKGHSQPAYAPLDEVRVA